MSLLTHELWARALLAIGALVVAPLGLHLARWAFGRPALDSHPSSAWACSSPKLRFVVLLVLGVSLAIAQWFSPGAMAAGLAAPWLLVTALIALMGLARAWYFRRGPLPAFVAVCGMLYLAIGGGWALADRAGIRPLGFDPAIVLLTAVHFHYAGFALPILTALAMERPPTMSSKCIALGVMASVPLTAVGITATQLGFSPLAELIAAWCMSLSGLGVAWLYLRLAFLPTTAPVARQLWSFGALFLACGMLLSMLYGSRCLFPLPWLDIPLMRALHGTANALGFTVPALAGWMPTLPHER